VSVFIAVLLNIKRGSYLHNGTYSAKPYRNNIEIYIPRFLPILLQKMGTRRKNNMLVFDKKFVFKILRLFSCNLYKICKCFM